MQGDHKTWKSKDNPLYVKWGSFTSETRASIYEAAGIEKADILYARQRVLSTQAKPTLTPERAVHTCRVMLAAWTATLFKVSAQKDIDREDNARDCESEIALWSDALKWWEERCQCGS